MDFFSCFTNAFWQFFACGTRRRREETNDDKEDAPYHALQAPASENARPPCAPASRRHSAMELEPQSETIPLSNDPVAADPSIVSAKTISVKIIHVKEKGGDDVASSESKTQNAEMSSQESARETFVIRAEHPFGCPRRDIAQQPVKIRRKETRLSLDTSSTADSIPQLVEVSTLVEAGVEASTSNASVMTSSGSAANTAEDKKHLKKMEKLKLKYRLKVEKAKKKFEMAQLMADIAAAKLRKVAAKREAAIEKHIRKAAEEKKIKKRGGGKPLARESRNLQTNLQTNDSGVGVEQSRSGVDAETNPSNPLGTLPEIPREWGIFHLRRGQRSVDESGDLEVTELH